MTYTFDVYLAMCYGAEEAILLQNIIFWIEKNKANNKHFYDGYYWTYNSISAFEKLFPFWNWNKIRRLLDSLSAQKAIVTGNYNKIGFDKTTWYRLDESAISKIQNSHIELANLPSRTSNRATPIPDIVTDGKPVETDIKNPPCKIDRKPYGLNGNVLLSDYEKNRLHERFYEPDIMRAIQEMSEWLEDKPQMKKKRSSHYKTLLNWIKNNNAPEIPSEKRKPISNPRPQVRTVDSFEQMSIDTIEQNGEPPRDKSQAPIYDTPLFDALRKSTSLI